MENNLTKEFQPHWGILFSFRSVNQTGSFTYHLIDMTNINITPIMTISLFDDVKIWLMKKLNIIRDLSINHFQFIWMDREEIKW